MAQSQSKSGNLFIGMMSGTSLDGIDSVLASFDSDGALRIHDNRYDPYSRDFRSNLKSLLDDPRFDSDLAQEIDRSLGEVYSDSIVRLIDNHSIDGICAVGCHGQTIIHRPDANPPFSWQAGDGSIIARRTKIPVVVDFRTADMQAGGQGAPLAPAFHRYAFQSTHESRAIVNIGGISNVTILSADSGQSVLGFDTGPGNALSDQWTQLHQDQPYDKNGQWALSCPVDENLLELLMDEPYFRQPAPKSLDSREFSMEWLDRKIQESDLKPDPSHIQSTLAALTADSIWLGIQSGMRPVQAIYLCGGGAHNRAIVQRLEKVSKLELKKTDQLGIPPDLVEACAFAWLAERRINNRPGNLPSVTGASREVVLGRIITPAN